MLQPTQTAPIKLVTIGLASLQRIAASDPVDLVAPEGALPPPHVAARALAQLEAGTSAGWCVPYLIALRDSGEIVGGCTFKGPPSNGCVEIGYGVARAVRGRGFATAAVAHLVGLAAESREVRQVEARILPSNIASAKVVSRAGFERGPTIVDQDGEQVVLWVHRFAT